MPTFLAEKQNSQNFVIAFEKMCLWTGSGLEKIQDPDL